MAEINLSSNAEKIINIPKFNHTDRIAIVFQEVNMLPEKSCSCYRYNFISPAKIEIHIVAVPHLVLFMSLLFRSDFKIKS